MFSAMMPCLDALVIAMLNASKLGGVGLLKPGRHLSIEGGMIGLKGQEIVAPLGLNLAAIAT